MSRVVTDTERRECCAGRGLFAYRRWVPRETYPMQPGLYVRVRKRSYRWISVDAERIDTRRDDGSPSSRWEDAWCNFVDEDTGEALRMRLDDQDWH
jgi:hypothetical protein